MEETPKDITIMILIILMEKVRKQHIIDQVVDTMESALITMEEMKHLDSMELPTKVTKLLRNLLIKNQKDQYLVSLMVKVVCQIKSNHGGTNSRKINLMVWLQGKNMIKLLKILWLRTRMLMSRKFQLRF